MTTPGTDTLTLEYAAPTLSRARFDLYRAAVACGAVPLIAGVGVFGLWCVTRWRWLQGLGLLVIVAGLVAFAAGCVMLVLHVRSRVLAGTGSRKKLAGRAVLAGILLLANFPVAWVCFTAAWFLETRYTLVVTNAGSVKVDSFIVTGPGINHEFGPLAPGASARHSFHVAADGAITFSMTTGQTATSGEVAGYVTPGMGGETRVTINGSGVTVKGRWNSQ